MIVDIHTHLVNPDFNKDNPFPADYAVPSSLFLSIKNALKYSIYIYNVCGNEVFTWQMKLKS